MKTRELIVILLKLMALYVVFQFLILLPGFIKTHQTAMHMRSTVPGDGLQSGFFLWMRVYYGIASAAYVGFAAALFFGANRLSLLFVREPDHVATISGPVSDQFRGVTFQCMGILALSNWLPDLIHTLVRCIIYATWTQPQMPLLQRFHNNWTSLIAPLVGVAIGIVLLFRTDGLLKLLSMCRGNNQTENT